MMACGESEWQYAPQRASSGVWPWETGLDTSIWKHWCHGTVRLVQSDQSTGAFQSHSNISPSLLRLLGLPVISPSFSSPSLIPLTSRLRINPIPIHWPLEGRIDIHGPPSAPGPMCIPQHRAPALCLTPGLRYLLSSLWSQVLHGSPRFSSFTHIVSTFTHKICAKMRKKIKNTI